MMHAGFIAIVLKPDLSFSFLPDVYGLLLLLGGKLFRMNLF